MIGAIVVSLVAAFCVAMLAIIAKRTPFTAGQKDADPNQHGWVGPLSGIDEQQE